MTEPLHLVELTRDNWRAAAELTITPEQLAGDFLSPNVFSIAEASFYPGFVPRAIYLNDQMVGFVMWLRHVEGDGLSWFAGDIRPEYWISRFMIAAEHQGHGHGRRAMELVIEEMRSRYGCTEINLSYNDDNEVAALLYDSLGFAPVTRAPWGETVARLELPS